MGGGDEDAFSRIERVRREFDRLHIMMMETENSKANKRRMQMKEHASFYKNKRTIFAIFSVVGLLIIVLGTLMSLKRHAMA